MNPKELIAILVSKYGTLIFTGFEIPEAHEGIGKIKAIVLGADQTHIVGIYLKKIENVFSHLKADNSPYGRGVTRISANRTAQILPKSKPRETRYFFL